MENSEIVKIEGKKYKLTEQIDCVGCSFDGAGGICLFPTTKECKCIMPSSIYKEITENDTQK